MVYSTYKKQRILCLYSLGLKAPSICEIIRNEGMTTSRVGIHKFLRRFEMYGSIERKTGSGPPSKITAEVKRIVEEKMREDDETTAYQLHLLLTSRAISISLRTVLRCRTSLGWTFRGSAYCQLIRDANKVKRLDWAKEYKDDDFTNVIYTDECTVQLETHRRFCCRKKGETPKPKPRPKHPLKLHIWAGISRKGSTEICIFEGIMDKYLYVEILRETLLPFIRQVYPNSHRFMADNDPKHTSKFAQTFLKENDIHWWRTPAESPDLNPIENLWHELKEFIRREVKPRNKQQLCDGIIEFWRTVDVRKCEKYIKHLKKVIPQVIELNGNATGY